MAQDPNTTQAQSDKVEESKDDPGYARPEDETKEFFDDAVSLAVKVKKLAELVKKSEHFVVFTGAGMLLYTLSRFTIQK